MSEILSSSQLKLLKIAEEITFLLAREFPGHSPNEYMDMASEAVKDTIVRQSIIFQAVPVSIRKKRKHNPPPVEKKDEGIS